MCATVPSLSLRKLTGKPAFLTIDDGTPRLCVDCGGCEREEMKTQNTITRLGVIFVILSAACGIVDDIQQKKGFMSFGASVALPLGILAILWSSRFGECGAREGVRYGSLGW
jgi:hypothetical protein